MMNMIDQLMTLSSVDWRNAFAMMEERAHQRANSMKGPYICFGEVDCPEEMMSYPTVTLEMIQRCGKTNWLQCQDGTFVTVDDATLEELIDNDKVLDGYQPRIPTEYDDIKTVEGRVKYRMEHQHIDERWAKELVSYEHGFNPFQYRFILKKTYTIVDENGNTETISYEDRLDANSPGEALELGKTSDCWQIGFVVSDGGIDPVTRIHHKKTITDLVIDIVDIIELDD